MQYTQKNMVHAKHQSKVFMFNSHYGEGIIIYFSNMEMKA